MPQGILWITTNHSGIEAPLTSGFRLCRHGEVACKKHKVCMLGGQCNTAYTASLRGDNIWWHIMHALCARLCMHICIKKKNSHVTHNLYFSFTKSFFVMNITGDKNNKEYFRNK
jgi:hypothetical protein